MREFSWRHKYRSKPAPGPSRAAGAVLAFLLVVGALSCAPPDRPDALASDIPASALDFLEAEAGWSDLVAPGVSYRFAHAPRGPWGVHLLRVDLNRCELGFTVLPGEMAGAAAAATVRAGAAAGPVSAGAGAAAGAGPAADAGASAAGPPAGLGAGDASPAPGTPSDVRAKVTELAAPASSGVLAAVNGDFFTPEGRPLGIEVARGEVRSRSNRAAFAWHPSGGPWFGVPTAQADSLLLLGWAIPLADGDGRTEAIAGFPALLAEGERVGDLEVAARPAFAAERHPRTAVAYDRESRIAWLVMVEGRIAESAGMTLPELTELLLSLGATEALNLDGGGSSAMVVQGRLVSRSSDSSGERPVANALGLRRDVAYCTVPSAPPLPPSLAAPGVVVEP